MDLQRALAVIDLDINAREGPEDSSCPDDYVFSDPKLVNSFMDNQQWGCRYNESKHKMFLDNPHAIRSDTVIVPGRTWVIARFVTDNPGPWGFYCQTQAHTLQGMSGILSVGDPDTWPEAPEHVKRACGPQC